MKTIYGIENLNLSNGLAIEDNKVVLGSGLDVNSFDKIAMTLSAADVSNKAMIANVTYVPQESSEDVVVFFGSQGIENTDNVGTNDALVLSRESLIAERIGVEVNLTKSSYTVFNKGLVDGPIMLGTSNMFEDGGAFYFVLKYGVFGQSISIYKNDSGHTPGREVCFLNNRPSEFQRIIFAGSNAIGVSLEQIELTDELDLSLLPADALYQGIDLDLLRGKMGQAIRVFERFSTESASTIEGLVNKFNTEISTLDERLKVLEDNR